MWKQISSLDQTTHQPVQGHRSSSQIVQYVLTHKQCLCYDFRCIPDHILIYCFIVYGIDHPGICPRRRGASIIPLSPLLKLTRQNQVLLTVQVSKIAFVSFLECRPQEHRALLSVVLVSYLCLLDQCLVLNKHQFLLNGLMNQTVVDVRVPDCQV